MLHDPEEEQDCFSDNTHNSHFNDIVGIRNVYSGTYRRIDGSTVQGPSIGDLVRARDDAVADEVEAKLDATLEAAKVMKARADGGEAYDQMIGEGNADGNAAVQAVIDGLVGQTRAFERAIAVLDLGDVAIEDRTASTIPTPSSSEAVHDRAPVDPCASGSPWRYSCRC